MKKTFEEWMNDLPDSDNEEAVLDWLESLKKAYPKTYLDYFIDSVIAHIKKGAFDSKYAVDLALNSLKRFLNEEKYKKQREGKEQVKKIFRYINKNIVRLSNRRFRK